MISQDDRWQQHYEEVVHYILTFRRLPSKHRIEDHLMLNWLKYNRKLQRANKLSAERSELFDLLLDMARLYQRINQYAYVPHQAKHRELELDFEG